MSAFYKMGDSVEWAEAFGAPDAVESWLLAELVQAYFEARRAKRSTTDEQLFEVRYLENLLLLRDKILHGDYHPSHGIAFISKSPVVREIFAAPFVDRVVHHLLYNGVADWWDRRFIYDSGSCRKGKGTLFCINRLAHHIRSVTDNYQKPAYVIKLDIQGYFMSLRRDKLYDRVLWGLERQFPDGGARASIYKQLWREVIFDDPTVGVVKRGRASDWKMLPPSKSLFHQPEGQGIVIGNLTSQLLSNIHLDQLDRYMKLELGYKHYGRYVDDFYVIVTPEEFEKAKYHIEDIRRFLKTLGLTLHPKKIYIQEVRKGIPFLGMTVYPGRVVPGKRIKHNYCNALNEVVSGKKDLETVASYMGLLKHVDSFRAQKQVFDRAGLDYH